MLDYLRAAASALCFAGGLFMVFVSILGTYRFKFVLNRMHSAAITDSMGLMLVVLGLVIDYGFDVASAKLIMLVAFFWIAGPVSSHLVSELETLTDPEIRKHLTVIKGAGTSKEKKCEQKQELDKEKDE